jgi:hypothetical protein
LAVLKLKRDVVMSLEMMMKKIVILLSSIRTTSWLTSKLELQTLSMKAMKLLLMSLWLVTNLELLDLLVALPFAISLRNVRKNLKI